MAGLAYEVREARSDDYDAVCACMAAVFDETRAQKAAWFDRESWEWQYLRSERPSLIIVADVGGRIGGYYHILALAMRRAGRDIVGGLMQDIGTLAEYRGHGIFPKMVDFGLRRMGELGAEFLYGFPNERSRPGFERNHKYAQFTRVPVYVSPLAPLSVAGARLGAPRAGAALDRALRPAHHAWRRRQAELRPGESVERVAAIDDEIAAACREFDARRSIHLVRSPRYLTWRFFDKPNGGYQGWVLRSRGAVTAFTVTREATLFDTPCVAFMDFGCRTGSEDALHRLVATRLAAAQRDGTLLAVVMGLHPFLAGLGRLGFARVPERLNPKPFNIIVKNPAGDEAADLVDPDQWAITLADWDVL